MMTPIFSRLDDYKTKSRKEILLFAVLFFAGATFVYLRVNLGFGWALGAHILNNLPAIVMLASMELN